MENKNIQDLLVKAAFYSAKDKIILIEDIKKLHTTEENIIYCDLVTVNKYSFVEVRLNRDTDFFRDFQINLIGRINISDIKEVFPYHEIGHPVISLKFKHDKSPFFSIFTRLENENKTELYKEFYLEDNNKEKIYKDYLKYTSKDITSTIYDTYKEYFLDIVSHASNGDDHNGFATADLLDKTEDTILELLEIIKYIKK